MSDGRSNTQSIEFYPAVRQRCRFQEQTLPVPLWRRDGTGAVRHLYTGRLIREAASTSNKPGEDLVALVRASSRCHSNSVLSLSASMSSAADGDAPVHQRVCQHHIQSQHTEQLFLSPSIQFCLGLDLL